MRLFANENVHLRCHDVLSISESMPQTADEDILEIASREARILLTFDKDFGDLSLCSDLPVSCGIVLFRIPLLSVNYLAAAIIEAVESRTDWAGHFAVVEPGQIRMRML